MKLSKSQKEFLIKLLEQDIESNLDIISGKTHHVIEKIVWAKDVLYALETIKELKSK